MDLIQTLVANLIGVMIGALLGSYLGFLYTRKRDQEASEKLRLERRENLLTIVPRMLAFELIAAEALSDLGGDQLLFNAINVEPTTLDSVAPLWHEYLYDLGTAKVHYDDGFCEMSSGMLFESVRRELHSLRSVVDSCLHLELRIAHGHLDIDQEQASSMYKASVKGMKKTALNAAGAIRDLYQLVEFDPVQFTNIQQSGRSADSSDPNSQANARLEP